MSYPIKKGRLQFLGPKKEFTSKAGKTHCKRDFVITPVRFNPLTGEPTYAHEEDGIIFSAFGPKCEDLEGLKVGDEVAVEFDVRGFSYTKADGTHAHGIDLDVIRVKGPQKEAPKETPTETPAEAPQVEKAVAPAPKAEKRPAKAEKPKQDDEDLPF